MTFAKFLISLFTCLFASVLAAQEQPTAEALERRVRELEAQVQRLQSINTSPEIEELRRQIEIIGREVETLKVGQEKQSPAADTEQYGLGAAASKVYRSESGLSVGGYGEFLYQDPSARQDRGFSSGATNQLNYLRAVLYTGYKFSPRVVYNSELEVENATTEHGGAVSMEFGYLDFLLRPEANVRAGVVLIPVGLLNEQHEPTSFLGARRPELEKRIIPATWGEGGVGLFGDVGRFSFRTYVVTGLNAEKFTADETIREGRQAGAQAIAEDLAFTGRVDWHPAEGTLLGGSFYRGNSGQGRGFDGRVTLNELHAEAKLRGINLRGLWAQGSIGDAAQINQLNGLDGQDSIGKKFGGYYGEAGYDLAAVLPLRQQSLTPFVRYERVETQKSVPAGFLRNPANDFHLVTTGVSWKPVPQAVIKIDYQNYDSRDRSSVDQFNIGLGYIF